jgi:hypothetical protein
MFWKNKPIIYSLLRLLVQTAFPGNRNMLQYPSAETSVASNNTSVVLHIMGIRLVYYSRRHQWQHNTLKRGGGGGTKDERGENQEHLSRAQETTRYRIRISQTWTLCYKSIVQRQPGMRKVPLNSMERNAVRSLIKGYRNAGTHTALAHPDIKMTGLTCKTCFITHRIGWI